MEVAKHPVRIPSSPAAGKSRPDSAMIAPPAHAAQRTVAATEPKQVAAQNPTGAAHTQQKAPVCD